jgi:putative nucleotidyltransferase with HDIG domain
MLWTRQCRTLRAELRRNRADAPPFWQVMRNDGSLASLGIAAIFCLVAIAILTLRQDVMPYRPGQYVPRTIHSRVSFSFVDKDRLTKAREDARGNVPRIYKSNGEVWDALAEQLRALPDQVGGRSIDEVPEHLKAQFKLDAAPPFITALDSATVTMLDQYRNEARRKGYAEAIETYLQPLRKLIILRPEDRKEERKHQEEMLQQFARIEVNSAAEKLDDVYSTDPTPELLQKFLSAAAVFPRELQLKIVAYTANNLRPTHLVDEDATATAQNQAADSVRERQAEVFYSANRIIKRPGVLDERDWQLLKAEHTAFLASLSPGTLLKSKIGTAGLVVLLTALLSGYVWFYQRRVVKNHARAGAIALLLLAMLLLAQLAAIGTGPLYLFGIAPTILVAMILTIAYDRRFAMGISCIHGVLVTAALDQGIGFFLILLVGIFTCCLLLDEIRTRSKLIEVGGATAMAMMLATLATGMVPLDPVEPLKFIGRNCLHAGAAGLAVGFIVLGILPFIEKAFRITTSMTLLELADASQPLLRRLALEAPGTYNHSLQVATLAEAAAEAIGANSLLCRVGAYYHDIGKMNKADYFVENQGDGRNRHLNLTPSVSLLIIIGHVKDGIELAREYNLPTSLFPFIQQHHGTTLVEYFYHQACTKKEQCGHDEPAISEMQYRYPGPKPRMKEVAIVMLADSAESACRAMPEPNASRIESLVHSLAMKRLTDGQFDDCDLTMRELERIERKLVKTLLGIYHGRIPYPSAAAPDKSQDSVAGMTIKTA